LGEKLRKLREEKGSTLEDVADSLGIGRSTLSGYENGHRKPNIEVIDKLAQYFKVEHSELISKDAIPEYNWIDLKNFLDKEDIILDGMRLTDKQKKKIYKVVQIMFLD
jgi:transcriptional regulator with XRE-family HTH domain